MSPVRLVTPEEAAEADMLICMPLGSPTPFTDNEVGECGECGCKIIFRPYMPKDIKRVCLLCSGIMPEGTLQ